ncbi:hypothetical protein F0L17_19660 [Streptomyces sp. TRM43335]|uniref:Uncharacterized protein n=1 Tax=Streptomyces taklimakanensis TaxID=2569853 RepID=A0A6G2BHB7_9ACTN|nr:hypothetical protein [Streptomyces taklimakanensis]MTE21292.1 hypothetical protein [Streptomyces taklimakanensis]
MVRREEPVPFAFTAESDRFRSNVTPPRTPPTGARTAGRVLWGLVVVAGLVGALLLGMPALETPHTPDDGPSGPTAAEGR